jgi:hypothetical protein
MEIFSSPLSLFAIIVLSVLSTYFFWLGFRERDMPAILIGTGTGVPTLSIMDYRFWVAGVAVTLLGFWLRRKMESM